MERIIFGQDSRLGLACQGPVHPAFIELNDRGGLGWLKGFNEWIVRCGLSSNGAPGNDVIIDNNGNKAEVFLPLHGKIANIPAQFVEVQVEVGTPTILRIRGIVEETMLLVQLCD